MIRAIEPCPCECNHGGFCGGCGHAGCSSGINTRAYIEAERLRASGRRIPQRTDWRCHRCHRWRPAEAEHLMVQVDLPMGSLSVPVCEPAC